MKAGYKKTEIGTVPSDWEVATLQQACREPITYGIVQCGPHISDGVPYIRVSDMNGPELNVDTMLRTSKSIAAKFSRSTVRSGDLVYALRGKLGEVRQIRTPLVGANLTQGTARLAPSERVLSDYFLWAMRDPRIIRQAELEAKGTTFREITLADLRRLKLLLPPQFEQRAIAQTLGDVESLVLEYEQLIAKKRDLKQATMQQLLTGQTRLPGFSGEWEVKRLGDLGKITGAGVDKKSYSHEVSVRLLNYMDVYRKEFIQFKDPGQVVTARPDQLARCAIKAGDVFFTPTSEVRDDIAHAAVAIEDIPDAVYSYHLVRLRLEVNWDVRFRAYAFQAKSFLDQASTLCEGSGTRYVITLPKFRSLIVRAPVDPTEQTAIANILSDMDAELEALEQRRAKTLALKQAMMQELLTGRTRLI